MYHQIDPIMTFKEDQSPYGVFDMAGNVQEWTRDWFEYKYYHQFAKTIADNPTGPTSSGRSRTPQHVVRGGAKNWSVTYREGVPSDRRLPYLGFRCVLMVEEPGPAPAPAAGQPGGAPPGAAVRGSAEKTSTAAVLMRRSRFVGALRRSPDHARLEAGRRCASWSRNHAIVSRDAFAVTDRRLPAQPGTRFLGAVFQVATQ